MCVLLSVYVCVCLTRRTVEGQVAEVAALDELHGQASGGGVVGQPYQQLRGPAVGQRLAGGGAVTLGHGRQALLGASILQGR